MNVSNQFQSRKFSIDYGSGFRVYDSRFRVQGLWFRVLDLEDDTSELPPSLHLATPSVDKFG